MCAVYAFPFANEYCWKNCYAKNESCDEDIVEVWRERETTYDDAYLNE